MAYNRTKLAKIIRKITGLTLIEFCEQHLKSDYKTFQMRMRKRKYYPAEVVYICWVLGVRVEDIFGYSFQDLVMFQGKYEVPDRVREMWGAADEDEKKRLLALVGLNDGSIVPKPVKVIPKIRAPKVKADEKLIENPIDFFVEIETPKQEAAPEPSEEVAPEPTNDGLGELFIETYSSNNAGNFS